MSAAPEDRVLVLLRDARYILSDPARWCRGVLARTEGQRACEPWLPEARSFSVAGALERALLERGYTGELLDGCPARAFVLEAKTVLLPNGSYRDIDLRIEKFAAALSHEELLKWFDQAIARRAGRSVSRGAA